MITRSILIIYSFLFALPSFSQKDFIEDMETTDYVYDEFIHTPIIEATYSGYQTIKNGLSLDVSNPNLNLMPVFSLASNTGVNLSFDDFSKDDRNYGYTIAYCNYDWTISSLIPADYLDGFSEDILQNYDFSNATKQNYRHFEISFPNDMMKPRISGNYLFIIFDDDTDEIILVKRFSIHEESQNLASVHVGLGQSPKTRFTHNELEIQINTSKLSNYFLPEEIKIVAQQNGRWDNALSNIPYSRLDRDMIYYNRLNTNLFESGSEYRSFDTRLLLMHGEGVARVDQLEDNYRVLLKTGKAKKKTFFINQIDINGGLIINRYNSRDSRTDADYSDIEFSLESPFGKLNGDVFILGELNDWNLDDKSLMTYHPEENLYRKNMRLKQGYYNYAYLFVPHIKNSQATFDIFEGNFSETSNQYRVYIYQKNNSIPTHDKLLQVLTFDINR